jgi:hypothetical protein
MLLRLVISKGWVVLVAAAVTGVALGLGSGSGSSAPGRSQLAVGLGQVVGASQGGGAAATAPYQLVPTTTDPTKASLAQMRRQDALMKGRCGAGDSGPMSSSPAVSSTHGRITVNLYLSGHDAVLCSSKGVLGSELTEVRIQRLRPDTIAITGIAGGDNDGHSATIEFGRAGANVHGLRFVLFDGSSVTAAVGSGWFLVWWPSGRSPKQAVLSTSSGRRIVALGAAAASPSSNCPARHKDCFSIVSTGVGHPLG